MPPSDGASPPSAYRFGAFELDLRAQLLRRSGQPVALTRKSFDTLVHLVRNRGRLVPREELIAAVWPDVVVEEGNLHWTISAVRKALADGEEGEAAIRTVRGQGYRFVPDVVEVREPISPEASFEAPPAAAVPVTSRRRVALSALVALVAGAALFFVLRREVPAEPSSPPASRPADPRARALYGEGLAALRGLDGALAREKLAGCVAAEPAFAPGHAALSRALSLLGETSGAAAEALKADALAASLPLAERRLVEANFRRMTKRWKEALVSYRWLHASYPGDLDIGLLLAQTQVEAARAKDALLTVESLRRLPPPRGDDPRVDLMEGTAAQRTGEFRRQLAACEKAAASARERKLPLVYLKARLKVATAWLDLGHLPEARSASDETVSLARASGVQVLLSDALYTRGVLLRAEGDLAGAESVLLECAALDHARGDGTAEFKTLRQVAHVAFRRSDLRRHEEVLRRTLALCESSGASDCRARLWPDLGLNALHRGDLEAARPLLEASVRENEGATGDFFRETVSLSRLAWLDAYQGNLDAALSGIRKAEAIADAAGDRVLSDWQRCEEARFEIEAGRFEAAAELLRPVVQTAAAGKKDDLESYARAVVASALLALGRTEGAASEVARAVELLPKVTDPNDRMLLAIVEARLLAATGRGEEAAARLREVVATARRTGFAGPGFFGRLALASVLAGNGRTGESKEELAALETEAAGRGYRLFSLKAAVFRRDAGALRIVKRG